MILIISVLYENLSENGIFVGEKKNSKFSVKRTESPVVNKVGRHTLHLGRLLISSFFRPFVGLFSTLKPFEFHVSVFRSVECYYL